MSMDRLSFLRLLPAIAALPVLCEALGAREVRASEVGPDWVVPGDGDLHEFRLSVDFGGNIRASMDGREIPVQDCPIRFSQSGARSNGYTLFAKLPGAKL